MEYKHQLDRYQITEHDALRNCMLGGKGLICLVSPSTKAHTYRFNKPRNSADFPDDVIFVSVLHENKYFYIGMIERKKFRLTRNSRFEEDTESVRGAKFLVGLLNDENAFKSTKMKMYHSGRCAVCGRKLNSQRAIKCGVGGKCLAKLKGRLSV